MTEDSIRLTAGRPASRGGRPAASDGHLPATSGSRSPSLPVPSEAIVLVVLAVAVLIAASLADNLNARTAWGFVTALGAAFIVSRGLAKSSGHADDGL